MKLHYWSDYMHSNGNFNYNEISKIVVCIRSIQMAYYNNLQTKIVSNYWLNTTQFISTLLCIVGRRGQITLCYKIIVPINRYVNKKYEFRCFCWQYRIEIYIVVTFNNFVIVGIKSPYYICL